METAANVVKAVKQAKPKKPSSIQAPQPERRLDPMGDSSSETPITKKPSSIHTRKQPSNTVLDSDNANSALLQVRISPAMMRSIEDGAKNAGVTKAEFLRAILGDL